MFGAGASSSAVDTLNPNNDVIVQPVLADGISSLAFSPRPPNLLVGTCWDNNVYCWEVSSNGQATAKAQTSHTAPPLCCAWNSDGTGVFTGGCDKTVKLWNLATNQSQQVAQHDAPVRHCFWMPDINLLATGSWDKTIRYWDCRTPNPTLTVQLPERVYAMDVKYPLMVVGTAGRQVLVYNLNSPQQPYKTIESPLKFQTRCVSCFPDKTGYLVGSIEGRVAVQHVDEANAQKNFTFKCHRWVAARCCLQVVVVSASDAQSQGGEECGLQATYMPCAVQCPSCPLLNCNYLSLTMQGWQRHLRRQLYHLPPLRHLCHRRQRRLLQLLGQGLQAAPQADATLHLPGERVRAHPLHRLQRRWHGARLRPQL
jgi:hypothetical protein